MPLRRDKAVVFSPSGKAAVTYRVVSGVMLASGDPIGDVEAWPGAIERFMDEARAHSWTPAVMGCSETGGEVWTRETGLDALELGDEAVVDVADFSLAGRAMRNVRQMVKRIERAGYETRVRRVRDLGDAEVERIRRAAEEWRGTDTERAHRDLLRQTMESEGFTVYDNEWWHFDWPGWREYPVLDLPVTGERPG